MVNVTDPLQRDGWSRTRWWKRWQQRAVGAAGSTDAEKCRHVSARVGCEICMPVVRLGEICEHNRLRSKCKEFGGGGICQHGRIRSLCKECGVIVASMKKRFVVFVPLYCRLSVPVEVFVTKELIKLLKGLAPVRVMSLNDGSGNVTMIPHILGGVITLATAFIGPVNESQVKEDWSAPASWTEPARSGIPFRSKS